MPIISIIGRKQWKVRWLFAGMYAFLIIGGLTMVYPFLLMLAGSTKSALDNKYLEIVPRFLYDDARLYCKHLEGLFNEQLREMNNIYDIAESSFDNMDLVVEPNLALAKAWETFIDEQEIPRYIWAAGYMNAPQSKTNPSGLREFKDMLEAEYGQDITLVNSVLGTEFNSWNSVTLKVPSIYLRRDKPQATPYQEAVMMFLANEPIGRRYYFSPQGFFHRQFLSMKYTAMVTHGNVMTSNSLNTYNYKHGTSHRSWQSVKLSRRYPVDAGPLERDDWEHFVRQTLSSAWLRVDAMALGAYQHYLHAKYPDTEERQGIELLNVRHGTLYTAMEDVPMFVRDIDESRRMLEQHFHGDINELNKAYGTDYESFEAIALKTELPFSGVPASDWDSFITGIEDQQGKCDEKGELLEYKVPVECLEIVSVEFHFQDWLQKQYGTIEAANEAFGTSWQDFSDVMMPLQDVHRKYFDEHLSEIRWEFITRNYKTVAEYLLFHGRGILNTIIYCGLAILTALLINPLAAYAMSRYRMPSTYKILLFLMCTMAFPPLVTAIPNFIMLRQLDMLNTFWAIILPGAANGYSIFLLKSFFDSLPQDLYDSAQLDGANEWTLFWHITMGLSKPILAVIGLNAFVAAYSDFMFAFVICQDRRCWTTMVWLYDMQQNYGQPVVYAALVIAAIPTFLIFLFCQNIIMRGIVVPSEK